MTSTEHLVLRLPRALFEQQVAVLARTARHHAVEVVEGLE